MAVTCRRTRRGGGRTSRYLSSPADRLGGRGIPKGLQPFQGVCGRNGTLAKRAPLPLGGGGWPPKGVGRGERGIRKGRSLDEGGTFFCTVAPLSRPLLTQGPPSPAEGGGRVSDPDCILRTSRPAGKTGNALTSQYVRITDRDPCSELKHLEKAGLADLLKPDFSA